MPIISIKNLSVTFGIQNEIRALDGLYAEFPAAKISVVTGASGCGKTTLLKTVAGVISYEGDIFFDGKNINKVTVADRNVSLVFQDYVLYPHLTVFDNLALPLKAQKISKTEIIKRIKEVSEILDIGFLLTRKPRQISAGQQQRVALAKSLVKRPDVILFDEPLSGLDYEHKYTACRLIKKAVAETGATAIYVTHDLSETVFLADYIVVMESGRTALCGKPSEVMYSDNAILAAMKAMKEYGWRE